MEDRPLVRKMAQVITPRGPDQGGFFTDKGVSLASRRLSIIDVSTRGRMPMANEDGAVQLIFNGEIYNHLQLRPELERKGHRFRSNSDTEVLVHGYEAWGLKGLCERIRGDFAFALWDSKRKQLGLARDRMGVKPLYYYHAGRALYFASEIKSLLQAPQVKRELDYEALDEFMSLRYPIGPRTLIKGIWKLQPGHCALFKNGKLSLERYWDYTATPLHQSESAWVQRAKDAMLESVRSRMMSDVPLGAFLSGGLDSSWIVGLMSRLSDQPVKTFAVGFDHATDELGYARKVAEHFQTEHREVSVRFKPDLLAQVGWALDEPLADVAAIPTYVLAQHVRREVKVVLTGDGGDEVFGGYARYKLLPSLQRYRHLAPLGGLARLVAQPVMGKDIGARVGEAVAALGSRAKLFHTYASAFTSGEKSELYTTELAEKLRAVPSVEDKLEPYFGHRKSFLDELLLFDLKTLLPDDYLMKVDKTTMGNGIEARVPFLDERMVELSLQLPPNLKVRELRTKYLQRKAMAGLVPREIIERRKHGFNVPTGAWLEGELKDIALSMLDQSSMASRGLFEPRRVHATIESYKRSERYYSRQFWALFSLELWHRIFIDPASVKPVSRLADLL